METNLEIFRRVLEAFNDEGIEGVLPYYDDDSEVYDPDLPSAGPTAAGRPLRSLLNQMLMRGRADRDPRLRAAARRRPRRGAHPDLLEGAGGNPEVEVRDAHAMTFRDGKIVYWRLYIDRAEALTDAGLDPDLARPARPEAA